MNNNENSSYNHGLYSIYGYGKIVIRKFKSFPNYCFKKTKLELLVDSYKERENTKKVSIERLRCQVKPFSELQGFSGKPIEFFPPYRFFQISMTNQDQAICEFESWLRTCLLDLGGWKTPKSEGGWAEGSLYRYIFQLHLEQRITLPRFEDADPNLVEQAISHRTNYYLGLFDYIKENKHKELLLPPIQCHPENKDGLYIIYDGHHRTSAYRAIGIDEVDVIFVDQ